MVGREVPRHGRGEDRRLLETQLLRVVEQILPAVGATDVRPEARMGQIGRADLLVELQGRPAIIEIKSVTPRTGLRYQEIVHQLHRYRDAYVEANQGHAQPKLILAVPGQVPERQRAYFDQHEVEVWDGPYLKQLGQTVGLSDADLLGLETGAASPAAVPPSQATDLERRLTAVAAGKVEWSLYQSLCGDILAYLFCPPLEQPIGESANESRINRRDFVLPNYADAGFWHFLRVEFRAHYVVVDAKNYTRGVKKGEILQLANYLSPHGAGLFGLIVTRTSAARSAELTRREQWIIHQKLILVLNDDDLRQMLALKASGGRPEDIVRQQIEDFRLGF